MPLSPHCAALTASYVTAQAVKVIRLAQDDDEIKDLTAQVRREVDTLRKCDSPFILGYLGSHVFRGRLGLGLGLGLGLTCEPR